MEDDCKQKPSPSLPIPKKHIASSRSLWVSQKLKHMFWFLNRASTQGASTTSNLSHTKFNHTQTKNNTPKITHMILMIPHDSSSSSQPPQPLLNPHQSTRTPRHAPQQHCSNRIEDDYLILHIGFFVGYVCYVFGTFFGLLGSCGWFFWGGVLENRRNSFFSLQLPGGFQHRRV